MRLSTFRKRSPHRVEPACPYFGRCGGCAYQHIDYPHQLEIKSRQVRDLLQRIGKLKDVPMRAIVPSPLEYAYRNRITVHAQEAIIGYFRRDSHRLIDIEKCPIAMDEVNRELADLRARDVPDGHYTLRAKAGPRIFSQTNDGIASALRDLIVDLVPANEDLLVDAFCGAGFFAKALLNKFQRVVGIDWDRFAIGAAMENASTKENYIAGDVEAGLRTALENSDADRTVLIVDPPVGRPKCPGSRNDYRSCARQTDLRFLQSFHPRPRFGEFAVTLRNQIGYAIRHVSTDSRDRGGRGVASSQLNVEL